MCIRDSIYNESKLRLFRGKDHVPMDRIALEDAGARVRVRDESGTVIRMHRLP